MIEDSAKANVECLLNGDDIKLLLLLKRDTTKMSVFEKEMLVIATVLSSKEIRLANCCPPRAI